MSEHQQVVDAFTDTPQREAMKPATKPDVEGSAEGEIDDGATDDLTVQGGE